MKDLTKYYIDFSKCSKEERKHIISLLPEPRKHNLYEVTKTHYNLYFDGREWWLLTGPPKDKTEISYPEFIKLFEGGEGENNGWIKIEGIVNEIKVSGNLWVVNKYGAIEFVDELEYIPLGYVTHYQPITKPEPPKF